MDALVFWTYQENKQLSVLLLGAVAPRSSDDVRIQIRNPSDTYQAEDVVVAIGADGLGELFLSWDGDTFTSSIEVGDIPPGAGSLPFYLRRITPSTAVLGAGSGSVTATPAAWTDVTDTAASNNIALDADVALSDLDDNDNTNPPA